MIESEPITAIMNYSESCNRILCASKSKLYWLHVKEDLIKLTLAANLPNQLETSSLLSLVLGTSVVVLCFSPIRESLVILINLKTLTIGEIVTNN